MVMFILELLIPKRRLLVPKTKRWLNNLALVILDSILLRVLLPMAAVGVALWAQVENFGLLNYFATPLYIGLPLTVILLDMTVYLQHVMFHALPILWRIHRVHHVDQDFDVTTGLRFHPIEIILSMLIKFSMILLLGAPALGVMVFEILLNATAMFNHSNIHLPFTMDKYLRWFVVTPDMHRVHHSTIYKETNSNFGFNLPIWDRLFGTYQAQPQKGHNNMEIGLTEFKDPKQTQSLLSMLWLPFKK